MKNILVMIIATIALSGCNGCKPKTYPTYPITDQRLRDAVDFKEGSYFVYRDSVSGVLDSFVVYSYADATSYNGNTEAYYENAISDARLVTLDTSISLVSTTNTSSCQYYIGDDCYGAFTHKIPFPTAQTEDHGNGNTVRYINSGQIVTVKGIQYTNVSEVITNSSSLSTPYSFHTLFSLSAGLIKFSILRDGNTKVWELIREHIIR